jgi:digeranylgeranylglycerophospholipid reductase
MKYDVVVVGGGPAGCATAKIAAESGAKVIIVERRAEIGVPVLCGEGISSKVLTLGIIEKGNWVANEIKGARIFSPNGTMVKLSASIAGSKAGYIIHRDIFDKELARSAIRAGADMLIAAEAIGLLKKDGKIAGVRVKRFNEYFEIRADIVVGADGVESRVGKWAGINTTLSPNDIVTCAEYTLANVDCDTDYCDFFIGNKVAPGGYVWVFPKGKDIANVGIGILATYSKPRLALRLLDQFIATHPEYAKGEPIRMLAGAAPVAKPIESVRDNLLIVGDAARHTDPLTAGGVMHALIGGKIAGKVIGDAVKRQRFDAKMLSIYEDEWKATFMEKLIRNYHMKNTALTFDDKTLDKLANSLKDYNVEDFSTFALIKALVARNPWLLRKGFNIIKSYMHLPQSS